MTDLFLEILLEEIVPSPWNPRKTFDPQGLEDLAQTIREHGVLEPAVVRPLDAIDAGEEATVRIGNEVKVL